MGMTSISRYRWIVGARGVVGVAMGAVVLAFPLATLYALLLFLAAWVLLDAGFALAAAMTGRAPAPLALVRAALGIAAGILLLVRPDISAAVLIAIIGVWAVVIGMLEIVAGVEVYRAVNEAPWLTLAGFVSITFGVILLVRPLVGAIALAWLVGIYALVNGLALLVLAASLRRWEPPRRLAESA
jgi:uncharacterized membrane protein HdeD (DUF308 family)